MEAEECQQIKNTINIKEEKIDLEVEEKLKLIQNRIKVKQENVKNNLSTDKKSKKRNENGTPEDASSAEDSEQQEDQKRTIEPVKSSYDFLSELFSLFNAAPPAELLNDATIVKKEHKNKKEKKKKHKKSKVAQKSDEDISLSDQSENESDKESRGSSRKRKKKKKHKHKDVHKGKERDKHIKRTKGLLIDVKSIKTEKGLEEEDKNSNVEVPISANKNKERKINLPDLKHIKIDGEGTKRKSSADNSKYTASKRVKKEHCESSYYSSSKEQLDFKYSNRTNSKTSHNDEKNEYISDVSLSDEESYLRERESFNDISSSSKEPAREMNSFYSNSKRSRSKEKDRDRRRCNRFYQEDSRRHNYRRSPSYSRSRSRSRDLGIDKKRLLEIARKNAISMFKRGNLPGCVGMSEEVKDKVLLKMRYGGRTVEDLTDFCKKISKGEELSDLSSDNDSDVDKSGNAKAFHHPFVVKEREPIVMHIRNSTTVMPNTQKKEDKSVITMQFPVSSGQQHRLNEGWVPVETKEKLPPFPQLPAAMQSTNIFKKIPKNVFAKAIPIEEKQEPAFKPVGIVQPNVPEESNGTVTDLQSFNPLPCTPVTYAPPKISSTPVITTPSAPPPVDWSKFSQPPPTLPPFVPVASNSDNIFANINPTDPIDVSSIITMRLNAMRRLQENPIDAEALKMMYNSQKEMSSWASSKYLPGQFTGSTGANVLKAHELNSGPQVWARRDQLTSSKPLSGGMGMHLLQKMGWKPGEGLGREKTGSLQPLLLDVKLDKRGLVARDDNLFRRQPPPTKKPKVFPTATQVAQNLNDKHPVCLLNELTLKRKWTPPLYKVTNEEGPMHNREFLFSVSVNGQTFTPSQGSNTKKEAKLIAARYCLQQIGVLP